MKARRLLATLVREPLNYRTSNESPGLQRPALCSARVLPICTPMAQADRRGKLPLFTGLLALPAGAAAIQWWLNFVVVDGGTGTLTGPAALIVGYGGIAWPGLVTAGIAIRRRHTRIAAMGLGVASSAIAIVLFWIVVLALLAYGCNRNPMCLS